LFSAYKDPDNSPVVLRNDKSTKSKGKPTPKASPKDLKAKKSPVPSKVDKSPKGAKAKKSPVPTKVEKAVKEKSPKVVKASKTPPQVVAQPTPSTSSPQKSPKSVKIPPSPKDKATKMSKSEPALNKPPKPAKDATPKKEGSSFWSGWFSSSKQMNVEMTPAPKKAKKPEKPVTVKKEKPAKEKTPKAEKTKDKKQKIQKTDIAAPTVEVVNEVPTPQPRSTNTNPVEATPEVKPRGLPTKSPLSGGRKTVVADIEAAEPKHGILQFVDSKPPQSPDDDDFGAWDMVNEHRRSISQTAALAAQVKPPSHDTSLRLKDNTAGVLTKPKTMRDMKKLSKENAELKMRRSVEAAEAEA
jgi:hypothetical protein